MHKVFDREGVEIVTVVGNWDTGTVQKVVADALAAHGKFDAVMSQHGGQGVINAFKAAGHEMVPMGLDGENGTRRMAVENKVPFISVEQHPAMSAVAMDGAVKLLQGHELPVLVALPSTGVLGADMKAGEHYFPDLPASFNTGTGYPACFKPLTPDELFKQNSDNTQGTKRWPRSGKPGCGHRSSQVNFMAIPRRGRRTYPYVAWWPWAPCRAGRP